MQDKMLVKVSVITDDDTGMYTIGDLDFGVPETTPEWLDRQPENPKKLADWMRWIADRCEKRESPFNTLGAAR